MPLLLSSGAYRRRSVQPLLKSSGTGHAFTLVEMLVSLAVMTLALSVVGVVFTLTTKTASQAAAHSEVQNQLRQFMSQIEEDLKYCEPSKSVLVLVGRTQAAALTKNDLEAGKFHRVLLGDPAAVAAGYDPEFNPNLDSASQPQYSNPRADLLMFFSNRPTVSQAPPENPTDPLGQAAANGAKFAPIQVVYGHAALDDAVLSGTNHIFANNLRHIERVPSSALSPIPANRWHLARRAAILAYDPIAVGKVTLDGTTYGDEWTRIMRCEGETSPARGGDIVLFDLATFLTDFEPKSVTPPTGSALYTPYDLNNSDWGISAQIGITFRDMIQKLLYPNGDPTYHHVATVLEEVPVDLRSNMGVQMLPGCAWFQVEFLMPEDPRNSLEYVSPEPWNVLKSRRSDMPRWMQVEPGKTYLFVPDTEGNRDLVAGQLDSRGCPQGRLATFGRLDQTQEHDGSGPAGFGTPVDVVSNRVIRMWPYAIRITVRVYDGRGRLDQPIVRSIVHRFE